MNFFIKTHANISKWCLFSDCDEFIYIRDYDNILCFINNYEEYDLIHINWLTILRHILRQLNRNYTFVHIRPRS